VPSITDGSERYTADKLIGTVANSVPTQFDTVVLEVEKLADPTAQDLLAELTAELDKWLAVKESVDQVAAYQHARVDGLFTRCGALAQTPALQTAVAAPALVATIALWASVAKIRNESFVAARPLAGYITTRDRMSVVDISIALFATPANAYEILKLNDFDDALSIKVGTNVRYLAAA